MMNSYINGETPTTNKPTPKPGTTKPKPSTKNSSEGWDGKNGWDGHNESSTKNLKV